MLGFNDYDALPGHRVQFKDGNLNLRNDPNAPETESILFLGTATDGPVNVPTRVTPETAYAIFGKTTNDNGIPNGATLLPAFEEAWQAGCRDIRLMRVTGKQAVASIVGKTYREVTEGYASQEIIAHGNDITEFTLPHGGIIPESFVIRANGVLLQEGQFTLQEGVALSLDPNDPVDEVKAKVTIDSDVCDMLAEITVSYQYTYVDEEGVTQSVSVIENNTDADGNPMMAAGREEAYDLDYMPIGEVKLYVNDKQILDTSVYHVDAANKKLTIKSTSLIGFRDTVEVSYAYHIETFEEPKIELESIYGGGVYNQTKVKVEKEDDVVIVTITKPDAKKSIMSEQPLIFKSTHFPTFLLLVQAINSHPLNNVVRAKVANKYASQLTDTLEVKPDTYFSGGSDELNISKEEMYKRLGGVKDSEGYVVEPGAYQMLENYKVDFVVPLGVYADDKLVGKHDNFAYQLALACAVMSHYNSVTQGLICTSSPNSTNLVDIEEHVKKLEALENVYYMRDRFGEIITDSEGKGIDLGQFISVIAGPDLIVSNTRLGNVASNTPATLAAFITNLAVQSAPTNKTLPSVRGLRFEYSNAQLNRLTKKRFITYRVKPNGTIGVVDAPTAAHEGSDYTNLSTARVIKEAINVIREVADPFIGEPNDTANRNALAAALDKRLGKMVEAKALLNYEFHIISTPQMELLGECSIEFSAWAPREMKRLTTIVGLQ